MQCFPPESHSKCFLVDDKVFQVFCFTLYRDVLKGISQMNGNHFAVFSTGVSSRVLLIHKLSKLAGRPFGCALCDETIAPQSAQLRAHNQVMFRRHEILYFRSQSNDSFQTNLHQWLVTISFFWGGKCEGMLFSRKKRKSYKVHNGLNLHKKCAKGFLFLEDY